MPPRPAIKSKESRPVSAIYLGNPANAAGSTNSHITQTPHSSSSASYLANGSSNALPDLPEPPSPSSSIDSRGSGLPSPPATNSTGSGSTGDPGSIALRQRPLSLASDSSASTGSSHRTLSERTPMPSVPSSVRSSSRQGYLHDDERLSNHDDDEPDDNNLDGDDTARLDRRLHVTSENILALQRVKNLTQRNRMAIDKLTRLGSPSPSHPSNRSTSSPVPSQTSSSTSSKLRQVRTVTLPPAREKGASGSETEREESTSAQTYSSHSYSSSSHASSSKRPITPPQGNNHVALAGTTSPYSRLRHISAPDSPQKARLLNTASGSSNSSGSPSNRRRHRASMASMSAIQAYAHDEEDDMDDSESRFSTATGPGRDRARDRERDTVRDITQSALAAVASSRRSPVGTRRRAALPREFREGVGETESVTSEALTRRSEHSPDRRRFSVEPVTPYRGVGRSSTLRETTRSAGHSARWPSEDYRGSPTGPTPETKRERRATLRGGSAESALWSPGGRTLIGEGLRAAGLSIRRDEVKTVGPASGTGDVFRERERRVEWNPQDAEDKGARRAFTPFRELTMRAATSMADYRSLDRRDKEGDSKEDRRISLKASRDALSMATATTRDRGMSLSRRPPRDLSLTPAEREQLELDRMSQAPPATVVPRHLQERHSTASPFGSRRISQTPLPGASSADHVRLLIESLASFESNVAKLPPSGVVPNLGKMHSASELLNHAQSVVYATERINAMMRQGTSRALEEQINAEVDADETPGSQDMLDVWRKVGGEYREGLRASDELVRALTGFLIDVGTAMRKLSPSTGSEYGSPATHLRSISLDEEGIRQQQRVVVSPELSGRRSVEPSSRMSWEPVLREREREREDTLRKLAGGTTGRETSLSMARASPALGAMRERERNVYETPSPASNASKALPPVSTNGTSNPQGSVRRLLTPSQQRDHQYGVGQNEPVRPGSSLRPSDSQRTVTIQAVDAEPSPTPTPASRTRDRTKTLPPLPAARPLPTTLPPSEQARRTPISKTASTTNTTSSASEERRGVTSNNSSSVRDRTHERRKPSIASIVTVRGSQAPGFPGLTTPSTATTGVTAHTVVSSSPEQAPMLSRTTSNKSARSSVTFSRPSTSSVSAALSGIQQQAKDDDERRRTAGGSGGHVASNNDTSSSDQSSMNSPTQQVKLDVQRQPKKLAAIALAKVQSSSSGGNGNASGSDSSAAAAVRRTKTLGLATNSPRMAARASLDNNGGGGLTPSSSGGSPFARESTAHAADRHAASTVLPRVKERRRTVTDIWPR